MRSSSLLQYTVLIKYHTDNLIFRPFKLTSILWREVGNGQADAVVLLAQAHAWVLPDEPAARGDDASRLLPHDRGGA